MDIWSYVQPGHSGTTVLTAYTLKYRMVNSGCLEPLGMFHDPATIRFSSVTLLCLTLRPHALQDARLPCPPPTPRACLNSCPLRRGCHRTISSSVIPFSSCLLSFPASGSFLMSQFFASGGQSIGASASASALPMNIQD